MAELTIGGSPDYKCSPHNGNLHVKHNGTLKVNPPSEGCTICFSQAVNGQSNYSYSNGNQSDISFSGIAVGTVLDYCTCAYQSTCTPTPRIANDPGHTITIDSSGK
jgi:hypothetical protein